MAIKIAWGRRLSSVLLAPHLSQSSTFEPVHKLLIEFVKPHIVASITCTICVGCWVLGELKLVAFGWVHACCDRCGEVKLGPGIMGWRVGVGGTWKGRLCQNSTQLSDGWCWNSGANLGWGRSNNNVIVVESVCVGQGCNNMEMEIAKAAQGYI